MNHLTLTRFAYTPMGTFGELILGGDLNGTVLYTVEKPWRDNQPRESCIPTGKYLCKPRRFFRKDYPAIEITEVPDRSHILFHIGNRERDVEGCIAVGSELGCIGNDWAVLGSKNGFGLLMEHYGGQEFSLEIQDLDYEVPVQEMNLSVDA